MSKRAKAKQLSKEHLKCNKPRKTPSHKTKSHVVKACKDGKEKLITQSNTYIQNWNKDLGWNPPRLGVIPKILYSLFNLFLCNRTV